MRSKQFADAETRRRGDAAKGRRQGQEAGSRRWKAAIYTAFRFLLPISFTITCLVALAVSLLLVDSARAQQSSTQNSKLKTQNYESQGAASVYVIRNARIVTVSAPEIESGTIVVRDGKIESVGASASAPAGAQEIDARGLIVYPGMIDAGTSMGLVEVGEGAPGTVDLSEVGDMNPNIQA